MSWLRKSQGSKQQINNHETSYQCHCYLWKKFLNACHFLCRSLDDSLKFVDISSISASANNADMHMSSRVCIKSVCQCVWVHASSESAQVCVLLERSSRRCRSSAFRWHAIRSVVFMWLCLFDAASCCLPTVVCELCVEFSRLHLAPLLLGSKEIIKKKVHNE